MALSLQRIVLWALSVGGVAFAVGFVGPIVFAPGANQGPLLGIVVTGPLGLVAGVALGVVREMLGYTAGPGEWVARAREPGGWLADPSLILRPLAVIAGIVLAVHGVGGVRRGEGRGAAGAVILAAALLFYALTGRDPRSYFRR